MSDDEIIEIDENGKIVKDTTRKYTQAEYDAALQSAYGKGYSQGTLDTATDAQSQSASKKILERTAAAMAAQKLADAQIGSDFDNMDGKEFHAKYGEVDCGLAIHKAPLASALEQKWLEEHDAEIYNEAQDDTAKSYEATMYLMFTHDELTRQLAAARLESHIKALTYVLEFDLHPNVYATLESDIEHYRTELIKIKAEAQARDGEVK